MPKNIYTRVLTVTLVLLLAAVDLLGAGSALPANAEATPAIALNGTVTEGEAGVIDSKTSILSSSQETRVTYRLTPSYSSGEASGVHVHLYLPSLMHVDGEYRVVGRDQPPTPLGVQGTVSSGGGWTVKSDNTVRGGPLIVEYDGNLGPGSNPAFDVLVTTYNDGTDGPYGGIPEGTALDIQGYVSYEVFNGSPGSSWETPHQLDESSAVKLISSDLTWEADIDAYTPNGETDVVPIWDRYQYIDYVYTISNTSENVASNIDGYSVTFNIDSTDSNPNGIIPFDINRWIYTEGETPTENTDVSHSAGEFVGVPGKGGVLIYDVTEWDGESQLTDPIPYTYSGTGMISIDREKGDHRQGLTPEAAPGDTERNYLISIPLSRQGFPGSS